MVAAVSMVKDEADIVASTVRRMVDQVDVVIVADNGSTDGTREILDGIAGVTVVDDPETGYYQSRKMTALAQRAAGLGAEWVVPFDADEVWLPTKGRRIADLLDTVDPCILVADAALFDHVPTELDNGETCPVARMRWRRSEQAPLRKVAVRALPSLTIQQGNHDATFTGVQHVPRVAGLLEVRHFPYRSAEQMVRKAVNGAAAYAATDLPQDAGAHWRGYGRIVAESGPLALHDVFHKWFWSADPAADGLVEDPCP